MTTESFGERLNTLRKQQQLTVHQLAKLAGVNQSLISGLNSDKRVIGEYTARKIGTALQLDGEELEGFIYLAINQCSEKILKQYKGCPAEVLNLVGEILAKAGIVPQQIKRCARNPTDADATLHLENGKTALINVKVAFK